MASHHQIPISAYVRTRFKALARPVLHRHDRGGRLARREYAITIFSAIALPLICMLIFDWTISMACTSIILSINFIVLEDMATMLIHPKGARAVFNRGSADEFVWHVASALRSRRNEVTSDLVEFRWVQLKYRLVWIYFPIGQLVSGLAVYRLASAEGYSLVELGLGVLPIALLYLVVWSIDLLSRRVDLEITAPARASTVLFTLTLLILASANALQLDNPWKSLGFTSFVALGMIVVTPPPASGLVKWLRKWIEEQESHSKIRVQE